MYRLLMLVALLVALAACGGGGSDSKSDGGSQSSNEKPIVYEQGDSIAVKNGATLVISLVANPTTGYSWQAVANANVEYVSSKQVSGNSNDVGAPGTQELTFRATTTGSSTLTLNYLRPFESGVPPAQTATFPVTVK